MSSVVDWLSSIAESIISLPITIINGIVDGIKALIVPDIESIKENFNSTLTDIQSITNLPIETLRDYFDSMGSQPVQDVTGSYTLNGVGTLNLKFFDTEFFRKGVDYFRPLIRGFIVLMLLFYNYKQLLTFIGQDPSIMSGAKENYEDYKKSKGGGKE